MAVYSIKDLERLSGIKAHTLRIWEKRYELLEPKRTDTNIREYCDDDLKRILTVSILNKNGYKISKIVALSDQQRNDLVLKINNQKQKSLDNAFDQLILFTLELDEEGFNNVFQELIKEKGLEKTFEEIIFPFLDRIGVLWQVGSIIPAQEHFISNLIRQKIITAIDQTPYPGNKEIKAILFLPEHELHEFGLLFYQFVLKKNGIRTIYLGQSVPFDDILITVSKFKPDYTVSSWISSVDVNHIIHFYQRLDQELKGTGHQVKHLSGGSQIKANLKQIETILRFINQPLDLLQNID